MSCGVPPTRRPRLDVFGTRALEHSVYEAEVAAQASHWWFVGRRRLFSRIIQRLNLQNDSPVLDVGTSTGTNLRLLRDLGFANIAAIDSSPSAAQLCARLGLPPVTLGDACALPFEAGDFALVLATDVIEHIEEDHLAVAEVFRVLRPGGTAIFTVPAFQSLWGPQDELSHHKRRYRRPEFLERLRGAGFLIVDCYYFNYLLFLPIWLARQLLLLAKVELRSENDINSPLINRIMTVVFLADVRTAGIVRPPFGVSILAVVRRAS
jgi:SAM-dependent methyltransferase